MSPIKVGKETGPKGSARISINSKGRIVVVFEDSGDKRELFAEDNEELMPIIQRLNDSKALSKSLFVRLNKDGTQIFGITPPGSAAGSSYFCIFEKFTARKGEPPVSYWVDAKSGQKNGKQWTIPGHMEFRPVFKIVSGPYKDLSIVGNFSYAFREDGDGQTQILGTGSQKLIEFLLSCGMNFATDTIPFSDNVLPFIQDLLEERRTIVLVTLNEAGYIQSVKPAPDGMEIDVPKKKAK